MHRFEGAGVFLQQRLETSWYRERNRSSVTLATRWALSGAYKARQTSTHVVKIQNIRWFG